MSGFELVFVPAMLLSPLGFVLGMGVFTKHRLRREPVSAEPFRTLLWAGTAASVGLFFILQSRWPEWAGHTWLLFFPLWFGCAMPLLMRKYPALAGPHPPGSPTRTASLRPRDAENPVPSRAWWPLAALWVVGVGITALAFGDAADEAARFRVWIALGCQLVCGAVTVGIGPWSLRLLHREAEPLDAAGSPELIEGYRSLRRFRAWGLLGLSATLLVVLSGFMAAMAHGVDGPALGIAGAVVGTVIGLAGAAFGTVAGVRRARLTQRLHELTHSHPDE